MRSKWFIRSVATVMIALFCEGLVFGLEKDDGKPDPHMTDPKPGEKDAQDVGGADLVGYDALRATEDAAVPEGAAEVVLIQPESTKTYNAKLVVRGTRKGGLSRTLKFGANRDKILLDGAVPNPIEPVSAPSTDDRSYKITVNGNDPLQPGEKVVVTLEVTGSAPSASDSVVLRTIKVVFEESAPDSGFDGTTDPKWLVVPVDNPPNQNTARAVVYPSSEAANIYFTVDATTIATVAPGQAKVSPETLTVTGVAKDHTLLQARYKSDTGGICETLSICVLKKKTKRLDFHYMSDSATPAHKTTRDKSKTDDIVNGMNDIWTKQANVVFVKGTVDEPKVLVDLGPYVLLWASDPKNEWDDITRFFIANAPDIYFVWEFELDQDPLTDNGDGAWYSSSGLPNGGDILMEDNIKGSVERNLAHEMGHFYGIDPADYTDASKENELMWWGGTRGKTILHSQAHQVHYPSAGGTP